MRIPLIRGRDFSEADTQAVLSVALVNRAMAQRYWPKEDAIGRRITFDTDPQRWVEVVGIVGEVRNSDVDAPPLSQVYLPSAQWPEHSMAIVVRTDGSPPLALASAVQAQVAAVDKDQPIADVATMSQVLFDDLSGLYILVGILTTAALMALGLAATGIYGVIAYSVAQRTRELGIHMALGAQRWRLLKMVVGQSLLSVAIGSAVGVVGGFALIQVTVGPFAGVLAPGVSGPATYIGVTLFLGFIAVLASYIPGRRATRLDPLVALRSE
jgi:putative ABC transport system permease protein